MVCGSTGSFGVEGGDLYLVRVDEDGQRLWSLVVGGPGVQQGRDVLILPTGGFLAIGSTDTGDYGGYDGYVVHVSDNGEILWERTYGTAAWDFLESADVDGERVLLAGFTFGLGDPAGELLLLKIDLTGEVVWLNGYGLAGAEEGGFVRVRSDGAYVLAGTTGSAFDADALVIHVDPDGTGIWTTRIEEEGVNWIGGIDLTDDNGVLLTGYIEMPEENRRMYLAKVSMDGEVLMSRPVSSGGADWEARAVLAREDGGVVVAGYTVEYGAGDGDVSMLFLDENGDFISGPTYGGVLRDEAWALDRANDGAYYLAGSTRSFGPGAESLFVIRSDGDTLNGSVVSYSDPVGIPEQRGGYSLRISPMPMVAGRIAHIAGLELGTDLFLFDMCGREVSRSMVSDGRTLVPMVAPGAYLLLLRFDNMTIGARAVLID